MSFTSSAKIDCFLGQALLGYSRVQVGTNGLDYANDAVPLSNNLKEVQGLLEVTNLHAATVGRHFS